MNTVSLDLRLKDCWIILVGLLDISCSKSFVIVLMGETGQGVIPRDAPVFDASHTEIDAKSCQSLDGFWHSLGYARCLSLVSIWMVKCFRAMMEQLLYFILENTVFSLMIHDFHHLATSESTSATMQYKPATCPGP